MDLNTFQNELREIKKKLNQLPIPFVLKYRPPGHEFHMNLNEYLDNVEQRLQALENGSSTDPT